MPKYGVHFPALEQKTYTVFNYLNAEGLPVTTTQIYHALNEEEALREFNELSKKYGQGTFLGEVRNFIGQEHRPPPGYGPRYTFDRPLIQGKRVPVPEYIPRGPTQGKRVPVPEYIPRGPIQGKQVAVPSYLLEDTPEYDQEEDLFASESIPGYNNIYMPTQNNQLTNLPDIINVGGRIIDTKELINRLYSNK